MATTKYPKSLRVSVIQEDIKGAECGNPNKCMIKVAIKRAIGGHGYVRVDAGWVAITRRPDYRERAFLPKNAVQNLIIFDKDKNGVKPFTFTLNLLKWRQIYKLSDDQRDSRTKKRRTTPSYTKKYNDKSRVVGLSMAGGEKTKDAMIH